MVNVSQYGKARLLIIDDIPEMRSSMRSQVMNLGMDQVSLAAGVREALDLLKATKFNIILCDYYLGGNTDGQQFLEFVRNRKLISRSTVFIMITAEKGYGSVITAAECMPDDYLLKPFTADALKSRIDRLLEKKLRLARIDRLQDLERWEEIIPACDEIIAAKDKYLLDAMRIKGNALNATTRYEEAVEFYQGLLQARPMPWAKLGLAKALQGNGDHERAKQALNEIVAETPRFLAAYDALGVLNGEIGDTEGALSILDRACEISPNALTRHRVIADIAERVPDFGRVEKAMSTVVEKTRNSPLRELNDYAKLGSALTELGNADKAIAVLKEAKTSFKNAADSNLLAAVESIAQQKAGNVELAQQALERAVQGDTKSLSEAAKLAVAKACLVNGRREEAERMLKHVLQNNPGQAALNASITRMMTAHGDPERAELLISSSNDEVIELNNDAVRMAQAGDLKAAATMLREAAERLPGNMQIVANAAYALFLDVLSNGVDQDRLSDARRYQQALLLKDRHHPKLADIADVAAKVQRKYDPPAAS
jgi:tetratricopeptide (TPR) repeat protein